MQGLSDVTDVAIHGRARREQGLVSLSFRFASICIGPGESHHRKRGNRHTIAPLRIRPLLLPAPRIVGRNALAEPEAQVFLGTARIRAREMQVCVLALLRSIEAS